MQAQSLNEVRALPVLLLVVRRPLRLWIWLPNGRDDKRSHQFPPRKLTVSESLLLPGAAGAANCSRFAIDPGHQS